MTSIYKSQSYKPDVGGKTIFNDVYKALMVKTVPSKLPATRVFCTSVASTANRLLQGVQNVQSFTVEVFSMSSEQEVRVNVYFEDQTNRELTQRL